ncbi:ribonuclease H-like domain-containing protein [Tanacetum coccineum]
MKTYSTVSDELNKMIDVEAKAEAVHIIFVETKRGENGNSFKPATKTTTNADGTSTTLIPGLVTTKEKVQKKNDMKARSCTANTQVSPASTQVSIASTQVITANLSDGTVYAFLANQPNGSQLVYEDLEQIHDDDLEEMDLKWQLALLNIRTRRFFQKTCRKITINGSDIAGYDKSKVECLNCHKMGHFAREYRGPRNQDSRNRNQDSSRRTINVEETSFKAMLAIDGAETNNRESHIHDKVEGSGLKSPDAPLVEELVSDVDKFEKKTVFPTKIEFVKQQEKPDRKPVKYAEMYRSQGPRGNQRNWNNQKSQQLGSDFVMYNKACFVCGSFDHLQTNCNYHQRERVVSGSNYTRVNYNYSAQKAHPSAQRNMVPRAVLMKNGLRTLNTARPVNTAHPKTTVYSARPMSRFSKSAQSTVKRPFYTRTTLTNKNLSQKVNTAKGNFYTARPKAVNTARPNTTVVNAVRANQVNAVKASACWVWRPTKLNSASITFKRHNYGHPQQEDQGYVDSGCSRHMTGNMSYLSDFKEFDGGSFKG